MVSEPSDDPALLEQLRVLYERLRLEKVERFNHDIPFEELLFDRWERARRLGWGDGTGIYQSAYVLFDVKVGANTWVGPLVMLDGRGGIEIGDWCSIGTGVQIYSHDTVAWALTGGEAAFSLAPTTIGDCTHVGPGSIVLAGVEVGDHCVIGAGSVVNRDVPPYSIALGAPARVRGHVEIDEASGSVELRWD